MLQCCAAPVRSRRKTYAPPVCIARGDEQGGIPRQRCGEIAGLSDEWVVPPAERLSPLQAAQLRLVLTASAIAGVHGQGLVWTSMLSATPARGCALLELMPKAMAKVNSHSKYDYYRWTRLNECGYRSVVMPDAKECESEYFRTCGNLTVDDVPKLVDELEGVRKHVTLEKAMPTVSLQ